MNVSPRASIDAGAHRGATATVQPNVAGRDAGLAFEQALQARAAREPGARQPAMREPRAPTQAAREQEGQESADAEPPPRQDLAGLPPPLAGAARESLAPGSTGGPQPQDNGATRTALAMALGMPAFPLDAATAGRWEVSIPQAAGAPLELRAGRAPLADGSAGWTLDIRSRARDIQSAMSRSASRLSDRLGARAISARVRIEDDEDEAQ